MSTNHNHVQPPSDWREEYCKRFYSSRRDQWPDLVRRHLRQGVRVLEIGPGPVSWTTEILRERAAEIVGIDIDPLVRSNRFLNEAVVYDGGKFPLPDARFDLVVSRWVNEHLPDPDLHFREIERVMAPGGHYVFRTVNRFHYVSLGATMVPPAVQVPLVRWLAHMPRDLHDPYPTYYRANTRHRVRSLCRETGLRPVSIEMSEGYPGYGLALKPLFFLFMGYERFVNSSSRFEGLRHTMDCVLLKPEPDALSPARRR